MKRKLRVWWIPQIPGQPMYVPVDDLKQAALVLDLLAAYDFFQLKNRIKPDYSNIGGVEIQDENGEWETWETEMGDSFDDYRITELKIKIPNYFDIINDANGGNLTMKH